MDGTLRLDVPNSKKRFYILCDICNYGIGAALLRKNRYGKMELNSANSCLFSTTELRLSTILRNCSAVVYELSEYELLIQGSQHLIILCTDKNPILFLLTQKNKPNHSVYKFQLKLMKFPNNTWFGQKEKNPSLPDLLSRSLLITTQDEHRLRTVAIPDFIKIIRTHSQHTQPIQCDYTVSKEYINTVTTDTAVESPHLPIYLQIKDNFFRVLLESDLYLPVS